MEWSFEVSGPVEASVEFAAGRLEVALAEGLGLAEVMIIPLSGRSDRAERLIEQARVELVEGHLTVSVPRQRFSNESLLVTLRLPDRSALVAHTASADVAVPAGTLASLDVRTASGDAAVAAVEGRAVFQSASGDLHLGRAGGDLDVATASGDLAVGTVAGATKVKTASGDISIAEVGEDSSVHSASGDVGLRCAARGSVKVTTVSGDVIVGVAQGSGAWVALTTMSGDASCELPGDSQSPSAADLRLTCRTVSGDILIRSAVLAEH